MDATYVSGNSFLVSADRTNEFVTNRRLKLECGVDGTKYATVISSSYSSPNTTVTIDESILTSNLTVVLYGIVQPGEYGSLPDHSHDGSEGSGGELTVSGGGSSDVASLLDLTDTPSVYDNGKYLRSTTSGIEWATASGGSGSSNHSELNELDYVSAGHTGFASSTDLSTTSGTLQDQIDDHTHSTFSGTSMRVDGDATVTGTMYAHVYDSYSPINIKDDGTIAILGDGFGVIDFPVGLTISGSSLDFYTPTEIDTWRNNVTQTEMGYLDGVTSDIQTQIDGKGDTDIFITDGAPTQDVGGEGDVAIDKNTGTIYKRFADCVVVPTTWNPADKSSNITLSPDNLTASTSSFWSGVRAISGKSSGKWYWEITINDNTYVVTGVATASATLSNGPGFDQYGCGWDRDWINAGALFTLLQNPADGPNNGDVIMIAIDMDVGEIYFGKNNVWLGSGNPAIGYHPTLTFTPGITLYPMMGLQTSNITANFGATAFSYSVPSGFYPGIGDIPSDCEWVEQIVPITTFSGLSDTPASYDDGKYLRSTAAGIEFATIDAYTTIEVDTISGTLQINIDAKPDTLLELTDTPSTYDDGMYLRSTTSGIEWATASGGAGTANHSELNELDYVSAGHTGFASSTDLSTTSGTLQDQIDDHTHSTFSGTSMRVDGDATVTGTMRAHVYDSYSPIHIKDDGTTAMLGDGVGNVDFPVGVAIDGVSIQTQIDAKPDTEVFLVTGVPSNSIGKADDIALDKNSGKVYKKILGESSDIYYPTVGGDDGYFYTGYYNNSGLQLYFGDIGADLNTFVRFPNIIISQGATIINAFLKFTSYSNRTGTVCNVNVYFNNIDDAVAPTTEVGANGLVLTDPVAWNNVPGQSAGSKFNSPELKTILQTVIDRSGWSSGNAIQTVVRDNSSDAGAGRDARSINYGSDIPELHITCATTAVWVEQLSPDFLKLSDTPVAYDDEKYLRSTASGIEFTDLGVYTTVEVDTISGSLQTNIDNLDYYITSEVDTISGTLQTQIDAKPDTLLDLTDTPTIYDDGKYLKSTTSGTEWVFLNGGEHTVASGVSSTNISFGNVQPDTSYYITTTLKNITDNPPSFYNYIISGTTVSGFTVLFSDTIDSENYVLDWHLMR